MRRTWKRRGTQRWIWSLCLAVVCAGMVVLPAMAEKASPEVAAESSEPLPLALRLERLMNDPVLRTSEVGIAVYDLTARQPVFTCQDKKLYRPASILKLMTGITALAELGPEHAFTTSVYYKGVVADSTLYGDLYVVGGFDSEFGEREMDELVGRVAALGVRRIEGKVIGDVSLADSLYYGDGWSWNDAVYEFQPCLSPLMFCKGVVSVMARPVRQDTVAEVSVSPVSSYYTVENKTRCRRPEAGAFRVTRNWMEQGNRLTVSGNVSARATKLLSLHDSRNFFMYAFVERLRGRGVETGEYCFGELSLHADSLPVRKIVSPSAVPVRSDADSLRVRGEAPSSPDRVVRVASVSHSLTEVLTRAMKKSDNLSAEAMLRHLALAGDKKKHVSASDGVEIIGRLMRRMGYDPKEYCLVDGSGVSLYNYVSPDLLLAFLRYAYDRPEMYAVLRESLPVAGVDGTLQYRMRGKSASGKVRAKTGTVTGISSLAGFARTPDNHVLAFVIINQNVLKAREARAFQDKVCVELCR